MTFILHPDLKTPTEPTARIWRFMDLAKFVDLLSSGQLNLRRADCFDDPYEGMMSVGQVETMQTDERRVDRIAWHAHRRADYYVTCWHLSDHEPAGMWKLYASVDGGVAITSSYAQLQQALSTWPYDHCYMGLVEYEGSTWDTDRPSSDILALLHKRKNFEHEREIRGLLRRNGAGEIGRNIDPQGKVHAMPLVEPVASENYRIEIDVGALVNSVVISPAAPSWWTAMVTSIVSRFGYSFPVSASGLYQLTNAEHGSTLA